MAKYRALREGLVGTAYINEGEVFELADTEAAPTWAEPIDTGKAKAPKSVKKNEKQGED